MSRGKNPFDTFDDEPIPADMHHWRNAFDSRFLRHFALNGRPRVVTIVDARVLRSSNKNESKTQICLKLAEFDKPWASNITNCETIEQLTGKADPRDWIGLKVELYPTKTQFGRETVDCIRVRPKLPPQNIKTEKPRHRQEVAGYLHEMKTATELAQCIPIADRIAEDNTLSPDETELLLGALKKRREQLGAVVPGAV